VLFHTRQVIIRLYKCRCHELWCSLPAMYACVGCVQPVVVELRRCGDELQTDLEGLQAAIGQHGPDSIAAVVSTTSCFAPR
jgi:hypothetical protein